MAEVGFDASALSAVYALTYQIGDYMGLNIKNKKAQCFMVALGMFWDIVTCLP